MQYIELANKKTGIRIFGLVVEEAKTWVKILTKDNEQKILEYSEYTKIDAKNHSKAFLAYQVKMMEMLKA